MDKKQITAGSKLIAENNAKGYDTTIKEFCGVVLCSSGPNQNKKEMSTKMKDRPKVKDYKTNDEALAAFIKWSRDAEQQIKELKHKKFLVEKKLIECSNKWWKQEDKIKELEAKNRILTIQEGLQAGLVLEKGKQITVLKEENRMSGIKSGCLSSEIKELKEEVDFWKSLATELEDKQAPNG